MGTATIYNAKRRSQTIYLTGSITPQNEKPQPGNSMNYVPGVESTTYHGVYAVPYFPLNCIFQITHHLQSNIHYNFMTQIYGAIFAFKDTVLWSLFT